MKKEIFITEDGSTSIFLPEWDEYYHSRFGAIQEARHVFIKNGLHLFKDKVSILEMGFGTGLNAFITFLETGNGKFLVDYTGIEAYPVCADEVVGMNYVSELNADEHRAVFAEMHACNWGEKVELRPDFGFTKRRQFFEDVDDVGKFDLIYFDAFGYQVQPELWSALVFGKMYAALRNGGVLVTYAARGVVKRNMMAAGFVIEKLEGPKGKREMFRAIKTL